MHSPSQSSNSDNDMPPIPEENNTGTVSRWSRRKDAKYKLVNDLTALLTGDRKVTQPSSRSFSQDDSRRSSSSRSKNDRASFNVVTPPGLDNTWSDMGTPSQTDTGSSQLPKATSYGNSKPTRSGSVSRESMLERWGCVLEQSASRERFSTNTEHSPASS